MQLPCKVEGASVRSLSLVGVKHVDDQGPLSHCGTGGRCCKCHIHSLCCSVHHVFVGSLLEGSAQELSVFSVKITYNPGFLTYLAFCFMYFYVFDSLDLDIFLPSPPSSGDSAVSVGEGVPGSRLLPPPHGPGGALPVAGPDDALSLGEHHRPRETGPVPAGVCH